jgi:pyruvate,water dikinase
MTKESLILWLEECDISQVHLIGGKNASLGEMIQNLQPKGINIPGGFATTAYAFRKFMKETGLHLEIASILKGLDTSDVNALRLAGRKCRSAVLSKPFPTELENEITTAYLEMCNRYSNGLECDVAVRSSATAEDLPNASFAGQQETFLNVHGISDVISATHKCFASLFTDRAICYRVQMGFDHNVVALSVGIQLMVRSDLAASGVMFSIDTESGFKNTVLINGAYGLGENVVQGAVNPDEFLVFKPTLKTCKPILEKQLGSKEIRMVYDVGGGKSVKNIPVPVHDRERFCIQDDQIMTLARWAVLIEDHYSAYHKRYCPMDMEWALDGLTNTLYIVQARPETVVSQRATAQINSLVTYKLEDTAELQVLATGSSVGSSIGQGVARVISDMKDMHHFKEGEVLVTNKTDPDWEPIMKKASGIITNFGGRTCHAAIIARELGIPAVVGCGNATEMITTGMEITLSCAKGERGTVFKGLVPFRKHVVDVAELPKTNVQILMNVGNPHDAFRLSTIPCQGVGLARLEFIIANHVKVHPMALIHMDRVTDGEELKEIEELTKQYDLASKPHYFSDRLASGIALIAAAFFPRPVIVRMSDFKSNEYANLLGGKSFEPNEENPMIGWRGASRYYHPKYKAGFSLECAAFRKVRDVMGLTVSLFH